MLDEDALRVNVSKVITKVWHLVGEKRVEDLRITLIFQNNFVV